MFTDKVAIITGGGAGIGLAAAKLFAALAQSFQSVIGSQV